MTECWSWQTRRIRSYPSTNWTKTSHLHELSMQWVSASIIMTSSDCRPEVTMHHYVGCVDVICIGLRANAFVSLMNVEHVTTWPSLNTITSCRPYVIVQLWQTSQITIESNTSVHPLHDTDIALSTLILSLSLSRTHTHTQAIYYIICKRGSSKDQLLNGTVCTSPEP